MTYIDKNLVARLVIALIENHTGYSDVSQDDLLSEKLGLDSLDLVEFSLELEHLFKIQRLELKSEYRTVRDMVNHVTQELETRNITDIDIGKVLHTL